MNGVYGRPASGLSEGQNGWAANNAVARQGAKGEVRTAELLNAFSRRAAILHDVRVSIPGFTANIDHLVVSGRRVLIIDSKMWKPGFYSSVLGPRRGWTKTPHVGKSLKYAQDALNKYLATTGATAGPPIVAIWSSRTNEPVTMWALRHPDQRFVAAHKLTDIVGRFIDEEASDATVRHLCRLLVKVPTAQPADLADPFAA